MGVLLAFFFIFVSVDLNFEVPLKLQRNSFRMLVTGRTMEFADTRRRHLHRVLHTTEFKFTYHNLRNRIP